MPNRRPCLSFSRKAAGRAQRKLRLFAVACSRRMWDWIDVLGRTAIEVAESFADGHAGAAQLRAARLACQGAGVQAAWYPAATNPATTARNAALSAKSCATALVGSDAEELRSSKLGPRNLRQPVQPRPRRSIVADARRGRTGPGDLRRPGLRQNAYPGQHLARGWMRRSDNLVPLPRFGAACSRLLGFGFDPGKGVTPCPAQAKSGTAPSSPLSPRAGRGVGGEGSREKWYSQLFRPVSTP